MATTYLSIFFNSRSLHGERLMFFEFLIHGSFSIHAPRMGSDRAARCQEYRSYVSIHAPRMESDAFRFEKVLCNQNVSIHAPRMESDGGRISL